MANSPSCIGAGRDSLKNGAIIGALAGGVAAVVLIVPGCMESEGGWGSDCTGPPFAVSMMGAGIGALIGIGVNAMLDRAPGAGAGPGVLRKGIRLHWRF